MNEICLENAAKAKYETFINHHYFGWTKRHLWREEKKSHTALHWQTKLAHTVLGPWVQREIKKNTMRAKERQNQCWTLELSKDMHIKNNYKYC